LRLLLSAPRAGDIDQQLLHPALSSNGAATRRTTATAGRAMLTAEGRGSRGFCMGLKHYSDAILFEFESAPSPEEEEVIP